MGAVMGAGYTVRPLVGWPGRLREPWERVASKFTVNWPTIEADLVAEIDRMGGRDPVLGLAISGRDLRVDGTLRANATPEHPGVVLQVAQGGRMLSFPCDRYRHWQDNVRAIGATLDALRTVSRHGVAARDEQYVGFAALPPAGAATFATAEDAAVWIVGHAPPGCGDPYQLLARPDALERAFRALARTMHPDAGGNPDDFRKLVAARDLIRGGR